MSMSQCASANILSQINHLQSAVAPCPCLPGDWTPAVRLWLNQLLATLLVSTIHKVMFAKIIKSVYKMLSELQNFLFWTEMKLNDKRLLKISVINLR